jgi:hypothetical protein
MPPVLRPFAHVLIGFTVLCVCSPSKGGCLTHWRCRVALNQQQPPYVLTFYR